MSAAAADPDLADDREDQILGGHAGRQLALDPHFHRLGAGQDEALRGENVLHLRGADADGEGAEGAVRRGMAVAADDGHAGLREAQLRTDHVHDPLVQASHVVERNPKLRDVSAQGLHLVPCDVVENRQRAVCRGDVVVDGRDAPIGPSHRAPGQAQALEGLGRRHLVDEMEIDVEKIVTVVARPNDVLVPDLLEERAGRHPASGIPGVTTSASERSTTSVNAVVVSAEPPSARRSTVR